MNKNLKTLAIVFLCIFALIGVAFTGVFFAMQFGLLNVRGSISERNSYFGSVPKIGSGVEDKSNGCIGSENKNETCEWNETSQWDVVKQGIIKDATVINRVSKETGVSSRMIVSAVIPEQLRFFSDNREVFKRYFEPLKILASLSKFSLGVSGIKQDTAVMVEKYSQDKNSVFYPGDGISDLLKYEQVDNINQELFNRLTDEKDHYYSYLYTAIFLKQIESQWKNAGYDISNRPDVLVTLFNLGFNASKPKDNPQVGGAQISQGGKNYTFGLLGTLFYNSNDLIDVFPR